MLPGGFKKDSRVWLHKNAHLHRMKALTTDLYNARLSDDGYDNMSEDPFPNPSPYITNDRGQVFKKDGRTWLHKSSYKKRSKTIINGVVRVSSTAGKPGSKRRQLRGHAHLNGGELGTDLLSTRNSTEMIHKQNAEFKMKISKNTGGLTKDGSFGHTLDIVKEQSANGLLKNPGASYHNMKTAKPGSCEVSAYASDFCIVGKRKPSVTIVTNSSSSDDDDNSNDIGHRSDTLSQYEAGPRGSFSRPDDGVCVGAVGYRTSNVEVARDGLWELERMMKEQSRLRLERLTQRRTDDSLYGLQHDESPVSSGSRVSLDACINLSEELGTENMQVQNTVEELSQSMDCLHLRLDKVPTCPDDTRPSGDSQEKGQGQWPVEN